MKSVSKFLVVSLVVLAVPVSAPAFLLHYSLTTPQGVFTYNIVDEPEPHWTLTVGKTVYEGQALDSAKFSGELALSFSDELNITRNGAPVEARLKGKIGAECGTKSKITLKDSTNDVTITLESADAAVQTCSGNL
jgi:hypothetical protein